MLLLKRVLLINKTSAKELASRNITVNAIAPGFIATDMTDVLDENIKAEMLKVIPAAQFGEAQDIMNAVTFLLLIKANMLQVKR